MVDNILELGTDIDNNYMFVDGDLKLVEYNDNLVQSIINRLNSPYGSYDLFYEGYGSFLLKFLGWKRNSKNLGFMEMEIMNTLLQDPRVQDLTVELSYGGKGTVNGELTVYFDEDTDLTMSFVVTGNGVEDTTNEDDDYNEEA